MNEDFYISLIYKKLQNILDSEEEGQLQKWLEDSMENQSLFKQIQLAWEKSENLPLSEVELDLEREFTNLLQEIEKEEPEHIPSSTSGFPWLRLAAAVLILLSIGYFGRSLLLGPDEAERLYTRFDEALILEEGSQVWLREGAELRYPSKFTQNQRRVKLTGEAYFEVSHEVDNTFIVETPSGTIQVLGTSFTVRDYTEGDKLAVYVRTGKVQLSPTDAEESLILERNQMGYYDKEENRLSKDTEVSPNEIAWHTQALAFEDTPLSEVIYTLEKTYQVRIELSNEDMKDCPFTLSLEAPDIDSYLEFLSEVYGIVINPEGPTSYSLEGGNCP